MNPSLSLRLEALYQDASHFPWKNTGLTLHERFREDRLGLTAGSLTFTTTIALVPFITVALAVFTAFPMFAKLQDVLQKWLIASLIPDNIARQLLGYLTQFAGKASNLGVAGVLVLLITALASILTIDRTLNNIWRVRRARPLAQRVMIYWAAITLGPLLLGASLTMTSYVISASRGLVGVMPGGVRLLLDTLEFFMVAGGVALTYRYVPNTQVKWGHAWVGGIFVSAGIEVAKKLLAIYLSSVSSYSAVYGAFATVPILLVWIYVAWVIVLLGAVIAAYLPSLLAGVVRRSGSYGWHFELAIETLQQLDQARRCDARGLSSAKLASLLQIDSLQLEPVLQALTDLDWIARIEAVDGREDGRYVLLVHTASTSMEPLVKKLLIGDAPGVEAFYRKSLNRPVYIADVM
jgi:membrane protein